MLYYVFLKM